MPGTNLTILNNEKTLNGKKVFNY